MKLLPDGLLARVSTAHAVSHLHIMAVPAMLPLLPGAMAVGFTELGLAIGVFNVVSALVQAPLGFVVDRVGARRMLMAGLAVGSAAYALVAVWSTYAGLLAAMALAGLANGVYHPADYALLSRNIAPKRMGRAFSIHTFAGFLGGALAPPLMVGIALAWDFRGAFAAAAAAGLVALVVVATGPAAPARADADPTDGPAGAAAAARRPLTTPLAALALLTLLFTLLSLSTGAIEKFSVSALVQGFDVGLPAANAALTAFLFCSAFGVLAGGVAADRTQRHGQVAAGAFAFAAVIVIALIHAPLPPAVLVPALGAVGFLTGFVAPSRDMLVRAAAPAGAEGRTFGIVSTGFNVGGVVGPVLFGFLLDSGRAAGVLWAAVGFMAVTAAVVLVQERRGGGQPALAGR